MIDPHVHLRDWKQSDKETIAHGLRVARKAGIERVFDMPNTNPPLTDKEVVLDRLALGTAEARKLGMGYHVYLGLTDDEKQVESMVNLYGQLFPLTIGLKMFLSHSTGNMGLVTEASQRKVVRKLSDLDFTGVLAVHAECEEMNNPALFDPSDFSTHSLARPRESEIAMVGRIIGICKEEGFKGHLHIAHISVKESVEAVLEARNNGLSISSGATAHHALYDYSEAHDNSRGLKMNPPLRSAADRDFIFSSLLDGKIDLVESDHAPHTLEDKEKGASGIPGFSGTLLLLNRLRLAGATEERLKDLFGGNAIRIFKLKDEEVLVPTDEKARFRMIENEYPFKSFIWK